MYYIRYRKKMVTEPVMVLLLLLFVYQVLLMFNSQPVPLNIYTNQMGLWRYTINGQICSSFMTFLHSITTKHWYTYLNNFNKMLINEYNFLGITKLSHHDGNLNADTESWLLTEVKNLTSVSISGRTQNVVPEVSHLTKQHEKPHSPSYVLTARPW